MKTFDWKLKMKKSEKPRCVWCGNDPLAIKYHDHEWGTPVHDDRKLFEMLVLEGAQAGLSWMTILRKRENYRQAFDNFDPRRVARYDARTIRRFMKNPGLVRNRLKIESAVGNAKAFLAVQQKFGSFDRFLWQFVGRKSTHNVWRSVKEIPATTPEARVMSKELKKRGFSFVGPTICYALMQAAGMVNDHTADCWRSNH